MDEKLYEKVLRVLYTDKPNHEELNDPKVRETIQYLFRTLNTTEPNYNQLWLQIQQNCHTKRRALYRRWQIVAAIFIPLFLGIGLYLSWSPNDSAIQKKESMPLQSVRLTLADGVKIFLQDTCQTALLAKQGISLQRDTFRQGLRYESQTTTDRILQYNTLEVPVTTDFQLQLSDGTTIFLNADSRLKYPTTFGSEERKVYLEGEAYFEVAKDATRPFRVEAKNITIEVLGTSFNVNAYPERHSVETTLAQGKVQLKQGAKKVLLQPGEQACSTDTGFIVQQVDVQQYISWKDGLFIFNKMSLEEIMRQMERWYGLNTTFFDTEIRQYTFTGMINKNAAPEETFRVIEKTVDVHFSVTDKQVVITKQK